MLRHCMLACPCALRFYYFFYSTCVLLSNDEIIISYIPNIYCKKGRDGKGGWQFYRGDDFDRFYFRGDAIRPHPPSTRVLVITAESWYVCCKLSDAQSDIVAVSG